MLLVTAPSLVAACHGRTHTTQLLASPHSHIACVSIIAHKAQGTKHMTCLVRTLPHVCLSMHTPCTYAIYHLPVPKPYACLVYVLVYLTHRLRPWTFRTARPCKLWRISLGDLLPLMRLYPVLPATLMQHVRYAVLQQAGGGQQQLGLEAGVARWAEELTAHSTQTVCRMPKHICGLSKCAISY